MKRGGGSKSLEKSWKMIDCLININVSKFCVCLKYIRVWSVLPQLALHFVIERGHIFMEGVPNKVFTCALLPIFMALASLLVMDVFKCTLMKEKRLPCKISRTHNFKEDVMGHNEATFLI